MAKRLPKKLHTDCLPKEWQHSQRFIKNQQRLAAEVPRRSPHTIGGAAKHRGAKCVECRRPLTLLWDLDLTDPLFPDAARELFAPATRIPFYLCWRCVAAAYRVVDDSRMTCFPALSEFSSDDETPFQDTPQELPLRKIAFEPVPTIVEGLMHLDLPLQDYDDESRKYLNDYYQSEVRFTIDMPISTLGGRSWLLQGSDEQTCRNPKCPASKLEFPFNFHERKFLPKDLGVLYVDADPVLAPHYFQLVYSVCCLCGTIRAGYQCG